VCCLLILIAASLTPIIWLSLPIDSMIATVAEVNFALRGHPTMSTLPETSHDGFTERGRLRAPFSQSLGYFSGDVALVTVASHQRPSLSRGEYGELKVRSLPALCVLSNVSFSLSFTRSSSGLA